MIGRVSLRYALRGIFRHTRRTLLSVVGAGVGCALSVIGTSWMGGGGELQIRSVAESGAGHVKIVPAEWIDTREGTLRLAGPAEALAAARALRGVRATVPRARSNGLLALGNRTAGVVLAGVDPEREAASNRIVNRAKLEGRYLRPDDAGAVVIGSSLARRLGARLDDDLYLTLAGLDEIRSAMLRVVGILDTGSRELDLSICHMTLGELGRLTGRPGPAEIAVVLEDHLLIPAAVRELSPKLPEGCAVITWKEVNPALAANVDGDRAFLRALMAVIVIVVTLGIASAQLTAVLERRKELAVLTALGMGPWRISGLVILEAVFIGVGAACVGLALGGPVAWLLAVKGVDMSAMAGGDLGFGDVLFDPIIYGSFGTWIVWQALGVSLAATIAASIYPAWHAARTDPAGALRTV
ncbi:MAG: ABC transporter permease [Planctomycetota bacterium]